MAQSAAKDSERIPHACLICAPNSESALNKAKELASRAVCSGEALVKPCGVCRDCRKVQSGIHPDVITLSRLSDGKGKQKQNITVDQIRALSADAIVLPNEAKRKVYIIDSAETMNPAAQNAALKLLEEPPAAVVFLLCTVRPMQLLETVRSRCALVRLPGAEDPEGPDEAAMELAASYLKAVNSRDEAQIYRWCAQNEEVDAQAMAAFLEALRLRLADMLCMRVKSGRLSRTELEALCRLSRRCTQYLKVNTNVRQLFGLLAVDALPDGNRGNTID